MEASIKNILSDHELKLISQNYGSENKTTFNKGIEKAYQNKDRLSNYEVSVVKQTLRDNISDKYTNTLNTINRNSVQLKHYSDYLLMTMMLIEILHYHDILPECQFDIHSATSLSYSLGETGSHIVTTIDKLLAPSMTKFKNIESIRRAQKHKGTATVDNITASTLYEPHNAIFFTNKHNMDYMVSNLTPASQWLYMRPVKGDFKYVLGENSNMTVPIKTIIDLLFATIYNKDIAIDPYDFVVSLYDLLFENTNISKLNTEVRIPNVIRNIKALDKRYGKEHGHISYLANLIQLGGKDVSPPVPKADYY